MFGCMLNASSPAARRYFRRVAFSFLFYTLFIVAAVLAFTRHHPSGAFAYALAVLPALPIIAMMAAFGFYLRDEKDELQRAIGVEALLWSIGATLSLTTIWGFLENFVKAPHLELIWIYPIFWIFFGIAMPVINARYR
jgi:hypothetical protein